MPLTLSLLVALAAQTTTETWVGHQVTYGERRVPILGALATRTDTFIVARVRRFGDLLELEQTACAVTFAPVLGVDVAMPARSLAALPTSRLLWRVVGERLEAAPTWSGWGSEDLDGDGNPGLTILVDAPMCDGEIYVANATTTRIDGRATATELRGQIEVRVQQEVLGASSACLTWGGRETDEVQRGSFVFQRAPEASCARLSVARWPVRADAPAAQGGP